MTPTDTTADDRHGEVLASPVLELRDVHLSFAAPGGPIKVLDGLDLTLARHEIVAVAGRSGSGKTTLITLVAGWEPADSGSITVLGASPGARPPAWADVALLPQSLGLLDELTVGENIALPLRLDPAHQAGDIDELMSALGIDHLADRLPSEISLGEQQRAALARAAMVRPRLLLADEPISHQNEEWARRSMLLLEGLAESGTSCLLATHNDVAFASAARVLEMRGARLEPLQPLEPS